MPAKFFLTGLLVGAHLLGQVRKLLHIVSTGHAAACVGKGYARCCTRAMYHRACLNCFPTTEAKATIQR